MKPSIHPEYKDVKVTCSCGSVFVTRSTMSKDSLLLEVCAKCHPFYTGTQKMMDTAGRVDRFRQKYGMKGAKEAVKETAPVAAPVEAAASEPVVEAAKPEVKKEAKKAPSKKATKDAKKE